MIDADKQGFAPAPKVFLRHGGNVTVVVRFFDVLTHEQREKVLIFDDSTYDCSRSKTVELLAWMRIPVASGIRSVDS